MPLRAAERRPSLMPRHAEVIWIPQDAVPGGRATRFRLRRPRCSSPEARRRRLRARLVHRHRGQATDSAAASPRMRMGIGPARAADRSVRRPATAAVRSRVDEDLEVDGELSAFDPFDECQPLLLEGRLLRTGGDAGRRKNDERTGEIPFPGMMAFLGACAAKSTTRRWIAPAVQPRDRRAWAACRALGAELGSTIRGTGVKGRSELGSRDVALFSTVHCNVAPIRRIQPSRRETYWVSDPGTGVAHPSFRSASGGGRDGATLHGFRWWPVTPAWWLAPVNVARSRRRRGWLAPVNSAPSPPSPPRRKVQRSRFGVPCRGSCSWPRSRVPAAMVKCNVRPACTVRADRSMVCTVHHRSCPASGPHPAPRRARQQTRS